MPYGCPMQRQLSQSELPITFFRPSLRETLLLALSSATAFAVAAYLRYGIMENTPLGLACDAGGTGLVCKTRLAVAYLFHLSAFGWAAVIAASLQLWRPKAILFGVSLIFASLGLVLYNSRLAALAVVLLVFSLARARVAARL